MLENLKPYLEKGDYQTAVQLLEKEIQSDSQNPMKYMGLGWMYENAGRYKEALDSYQIALFFLPSKWSKWFRVLKLKRKIKSIHKKLEQMEKDASESWGLQFYYYLKLGIILLLLIPVYTDFMYL